jgi:hypothetical protein
MCGRCVSFPGTLESTVGAKHHHSSTNRDPQAWPGLCVCSEPWNAGLLPGHAHSRFSWDTPRSITPTGKHSAHGAMRCPAAARLALINGVAGHGL